MRGVTLRLLLALCLLASTVQGFVAQTHVHAPLPVLAASPDAGPAADASPAADAACFLCAVAGHSPAAAPPVVASALAHPDAALAAPGFPTAELSATAASHHWRGRAPPTV